jgi:hypothetical protein
MKFWLENLMERDHLEDVGIDERIMLEWILWKWCWKVWTECIWFNISSSGRLL